MGTLVSDIRFAFRMIRTNPGFTAIAVAALALGIGANTAIFTVVNAVLMQPLPYPQPDRIMRLGRSYPNGQGYSNSIPKYMRWRQNRSFAAMTLYGQSAPGMNFGSGDRPNEIKTLSVSKEYFAVFGVQPILGRIFLPDEDRPNGRDAAVISYHAWQSQLGGDPNVVGRSILLNRRPYIVVGVLPGAFQPQPDNVDIWLPLQADPASTNQGHYLAVAGRLNAGVSLEKARAEMKLVGQQFRRDYPQWMDKTESVAVVPFRDALVGDVKLPLTILLWAVGFVLLIACANVANLLLARAAVRQREFAIRLAVGASDRRVVRQLLTESILLAMIGGALGFVIGSWGVRALLLLAPGNIPRLTNDAGVTQPPPLDWQVALFTLGVAFLTGILFGLVPALQISKPDLASTLKESSSRSGTGLRGNRARSVLVVSEIALALVLLIGAALLIRTFTGLRAVNPGLDPHNVLTLQTSMASGAYSTTAKVAYLSEQVRRRLESLPGIEAAASSIMLPMSEDVDLPFNIVGKAPSNGDRYNGDEQWRSVTPRYFDVFHVNVRRGRGFRETDTANSGRVVVINEAMAKKYWPKEDPIGQVMVIGKGLGPDFDDPPRQVVGVVSNMRETGLDSTNLCAMYIPQTQAPEGITKLANSVLPLAWEIRTAADPLTMRTAVEREFHAIDSTLTLAQMRTMEQVIQQSLARQSFNMTLLTVFAGIALLLAAIGIYGLMAYSVQQRVQEMGIRMALGAGRGSMIMLVVSQSLKFTLTGVAIGLASAYGLTRFLGSLLFGVKAFDPVTFAAVSVTLTIVAILATYIPARRAAGVDPTVALRFQ